MGRSLAALALRARGGVANDGRAMGSFIDECLQADPAGCRDTYRLPGRLSCTDEGWARRDHGHMGIAA